ncbi:hypothetical protein SPBRAN_1789 [uncultured Candidatus Thioglobus sp.]|nr:hypothetical protein SPBRAN_1789 [uncultured Candidatus Thioglobus sp.]
MDVFSALNSDAKHNFLNGFLTLNNLCLLPNNKKMRPLHKYE